MISSPVRPLPIPFAKARSSHPSLVCPSDRFVPITKESVGERIRGKEVVQRRQGLRLHSTLFWRRRVRPFSAIQSYGYRSLNEGEAIGFELKQGPKGLNAVEVTRPA